jgi:hypothetical protein
MNKVNKQKVLCICEKCLVKSNGIGMYVHSSTKYRHENIEKLYKDNESVSSSESASSSINDCPMTLYEINDNIGKD